MADYIDRGMAIAKLTALEVTDQNATITDAKRVLADMLAADVAPVKHDELDHFEFHRCRGRNRGCNRVSDFPQKADTNLRNV